jgi:hypothetical protein
VFIRGEKLWNQTFFCGVLTLPTPKEVRMFFRIRIAVGIAFLLSLVTSMTAFAKGGFTFIGITGPNLKAELRVDDPALTTDFFAFANFSEDKIKAPADPGVGYEITRYYVDGKREIIFDRLHYYPETGLVFYDGIENGESEYDGEWYTANPGIMKVFESALAGKRAAVEKKQPVTSASGLAAEDSAARSKPGSNGSQSLLVITVVVVSGLAALFGFAFGRRKPSVQ